MRSPGASLVQLRFEFPIEQPNAQHFVVFVPVDVVEDEGPLIAGGTVRWPLEMYPIDEPVSARPVATNSLCCSSIHLLWALSSRVFLYGLLRKRSVQCLQTLDATR